MKHTSDAILHPRQAAYLERVEAARTGILIEMEALASEQRQPISDPEVASFLAITVRASGAKRIVEVGTNIGYGAIVMARAAGAGAKIVTIEKSPALCETARKFIARADLSDRIEVREASATVALEKLEGEIDFAYVDCVKEEYPRYLELLVPHLRGGGVIVADNVLWRGYVADGDVPPDESVRVEALRKFNAALLGDARLRAVILPLGDGVAYAVKL